MQGEIFDNDTLNDVSSLLLISKDVLRTMKVNDIMYQVRVIVSPVNEFRGLEDENEMDYESGRLLLRSLSEQIGRSEQ